jgi:hypothetical protein
MALMPPFNRWNLPESPHTISVDHEDFHIGGKLVTTQIILSHLDSMSFRSDEDFKRSIKTKLVHRLVEHLIDAKLVEVTYAEDHSDLVFAVRARAYLAPDSQVKTLRKLK